MTPDAKIIADFEKVLEYAGTTPDVDRFLALAKLGAASEAQQSIILETLELFDDLLYFPYPESVFPRLTEEDWDLLKVWCESRGFPLDRLSAEYGRVFREGFASPVKIAQSKLKAATGKGDA